MDKLIEKIFEGANAEEQNVLLHIINKTTLSVLLLEDLHNLGYKIVKKDDKDIKGRFVNWNTIDIKPKDNSWVLIQSSLKNVPKYEVGIYENGEWYLPANDDVCQEYDIAKWCYIENPSAEQSAEQCSFCGNENVTTECDGVWCAECSTWENRKK